uniref:Uncharacterized protein n=1 Tax=Cannabis sativa TaxID=3483 RepID=A0A803RA68_CANSA
MGIIGGNNIGDRISGVTKREEINVLGENRRALRALNGLREALGEFKEINLAEQVTATEYPRNRSIAVIVL